MNFKQIKNIFILASIVLLSQTMFSIIIDENLSVFFFIVLYSLLFILIQYFLIFSIIPLVLIKSKYKNLIIKFSVSGSLALMSITFVLSTSVSFLILHISYKFFYIPIIITILIFSLFHVKYQFFYVLSKGFLIGLMIFNMTKLSSTIYNQYLNQGIGKTQKINTKKLQDIVFVKKPNIHIFFFDALSPNHILKNKINYEAMHNKILNQKFNILPNVFSDGVPTIPTMNSMFYLDMKKWSQLDHLNKYNLFNGLYNSPLRQIFKNNGYNIGTGADLGKSVRGNFVDFDTGMTPNKFFNIEVPSFCNFHGKSKALLFYGVCVFFQGFNFSKMQIIDNLNYYHKSKKHWLTINFISHPGHVPLDFNPKDQIKVKNFKSHYIKKDKKFVTPLINNIHEIVNKNNSNDIILIFGDHGLLFTLYPHQAFSIKNQKEIVIDRYTIQGAHLNIEKFCRMETFQGKSFNTPNLIITSLVRCLAENENLFSEIDFDTIYETSSITKILKTNLKRSDYTKN